MAFQHSNSQSKERPKRNQITRRYDWSRCNDTKPNLGIPNVKEQPTYIDFNIIRCLLDNPRMEISDISEIISVSSKTVARRLDKMIENHVLDFTLQFNFTAIRGYIVSVVSTNIEKGSYTKVIERSYEDFKDSFCIYSPMLSQQDVVYWLYFSKDVFALDYNVKT